MAIEMVDCEILGAGMQYVEVAPEPGAAVVGGAGSLICMPAGIAAGTPFGDHRLPDAGQVARGGQAAGGGWPASRISPPFTRTRPPPSRRWPLPAGKIMAMKLHPHCGLFGGVLGGDPNPAMTQPTDAPGAQRPAPGWPRRGWLLASAVLALSPLRARAQAAGAAGAAPAAARPIFVLNSLDADVSLIDPRTYTTLRRIPTGKEPHHLYLTPDEGSVIVANALSNSLTFIDPASGQVQRTLRNIVDPYHLRFSPDMQWFVIAANRLNHVDIYRWQPAAAEPLQLVKRIAAARTPSHLSIDTRSRTVYVSLQDSDEITAIDLATQQRGWTVKVGKMPADIFLAPDDRTLFVALTGDRFVEAWDVSLPAPRLIKRIATGDGAHAFRARGDRRHLFVSNRVANTISLIDMDALAVVAEYPAPGGPDCMELLADGRTLLVSSRWARRLTFIDTVAGKVVRQVEVGRSPHGVWTLDHAPRL